MRDFCKRLGALLLALCLMAVLVPVRAEAVGQYTRISGENRFETAFKVADAMKQVLGVDKFQAIVVASGSNFADALSGSYLANVKHAPILLSYNDTYNNKAKDYIRANLAPGGTVYILGGTSAVPKSMESGLDGFRIRRLAGANRFETNLLILKEAGVPNGTKVLVCTGTNFADSLSASATGLPIFLVYNESGKLTDSQKQYLATLRCDYYIVGGTSAVSNKLGGAFFQYSENVWRISGKNRFETSVTVAKHFCGQPKQAVLAYAWNYPDGLCGGPLAYAMGCPLVLTMTGYEAEADSYTQLWNITKGTVLGSTGLISDPSAVQIFTKGKPGNEYRPAYDLGGAKVLEGRPYVLALYVDDNESSWDSNTVSYSWNNKILPGLAFLEEWAAKWGVGLDVQEGSYYTGMSDGVRVKYNGTIYDNLGQKEGADYSRDILEQISVSLGFQDPNDMDRFIREFSGASDVVYLVMVNKDGRSYAMPDTRHDGEEQLEYCMIYSYGKDYEYELRVGTVSHEILHCFGAEDSYYENGNNTNRSALAAQYYPHDIMLTVDWNIADNWVHEITAYSVGWLKTMPSLCYDSRWWS